MVKVEIFNQSQLRVPRSYISNFSRLLFRELKRRKLNHLLKSFSLLTVVFVEAEPARALNLKFRGKDYATDVLSFESLEETSLGELVMCPEILKLQAKDHGLSYRDESCYMVLHGILHLMGFEHEESPQKAQEMFKLQDTLFETILSKI